jgi:3',5'-nucleoside bisphosphate phosphatase
VTMPARQPFTQLCQQLSRPRFAGRADLHTHTTCSDGGYTPAQLVDLARRSGLSALAVTDHDTTDGLAPARHAAADGSVEIVSGVEITAEFRGKELHLLGYFFRPDHASLQDALARLRSDRVERFWEMVRRLEHLGIALPVGSFPDLGEQGSLGRRHLAEALVRARKTATVREAFQRYLGDQGRATVPKRRLPVAEAIGLVRTAGGVAAWAHPAYDCDQASLRELAGLGLGAVEVDFPSCRAGRAGELRRWAAALGLAVTGGSDCHGPDQPGRPLGCCGVTHQELNELRKLANEQE